MHVAARSHLVAGVALVGAGAIAVSPVAPPVPDIVAASPVVQLSAAIDPITPWVNVFETAGMNFADLVQSWLEAPAPVLQQIIANQIRYIGELPDLPVIFQQMAANAEAAIRAPFAEDLTTLTPEHADVYELLLNGIPPIIDPVVPPDLKPLVQFSTTYLSGVLLGLVGPIINPVLALGGSLQAVVDNLTSAAPDVEAAFNTLINTPAAMADSFLNGGQQVDVTNLLKALGIDSPIPGLDFKADLVFGGLLSPGGSIFNAMTIDLGDGSGPTGIGPGAIGSLIGLTKAIAQAIGWSGTGNPLVPPAAEEPQPALAVTTAVAEVPSDTATLVSLDLSDTSSNVEPAAGPAGDSAPAVGDPVPTTQPVTADDDEITVDDDPAGDDAVTEDTVTDTEDTSEESNPVDDTREDADEDAADGPETPDSKYGHEDKAEDKAAESDSQASDSAGSDDKTEAGSDGGPSDKADDKASGSA